MVWQSLSSSQTTNGDGRCQLNLENVKWTSAHVVGEQVLDGIRYMGRTAMEPGDDKLITLHLHRPVQLSGKLTRGEEPAIGVGLVMYETLDSNNQPRGWSSIQRCGETKTDQFGRYSFACQEGLRYAIALEERDPQGVQQTLYRTPEILTAKPYSLPDLEIETAGQRQ